MQAAPLPTNEVARLDALRSFAILDTPRDPRFDRLVKLAAHVFDVRTVTIALMDADRLWFKAKVGTEIPQVPRNLAFCGWTVLGGEVFVIEDTAKDERFCDHPAMIDGQPARFYAGAPLITAEGYTIGTLAMMDVEPRAVSEAQRQQLREFAGLAMDALELHRSLARTEAAHEEAELASRAKGEFLAFMSHELRTPLNAVIGFAEMTESEAFGPLGDSRYKDYAGLIRQAGSHLLEVINSILDLSRIEAGKMTLTLDQLTVVDEADAVISLLLSQARQKEQSLVMDASLHALPKLHADRSAFRQVLLNLISNAIKFTPAEGRIVVAGKVETTGALRISVRDDGPGIAPGDLKRLGEAFYQAGPKNQRQQGTGLGLTISHRLMGLHGGHLHIESELGRGTAASMIFPASTSLGE